MSKARKKQPKPKPKRQINKKNLWAVVLMVLVFLEAVVGIVGLVVLSKMNSDAPTLSIDDFYTTESTRVYDKDGNMIADVGTTIRENVTYDQLPESLIDAFLAVEDSRYWEHDGFDLSRFTKAVIETVLGNTQGGSTFTMQLVKLTYFQNDEAGVSRTKDIEYKIQQIALARQLEKQSTKQDIFVMYLNKMNFGGSGNIRGVQKAANYYFGKPVNELNISESALLAGIINSPYYYDPHNFLDRATARRDVVLSLMKRHGYITNMEYQLARSIKVEDLLIDPNSQTGAGGSGYAYQSYIDTAIQEAAQLSGQDPTTVAMDIYTYMDPNVQSVMDRIQAGQEDSVQFPDELMEVGMISENNQTGEIVAIGGGRNYGRGGSMLLNHATDQYKQPGSSVKPFLDYALAFEYLGWATDHVVTDRPINYQGTNIVIQNANRTYQGQMSLVQAVCTSLNTPAIQALQDVINTAGWETVTNYVTSLGFSQVSADNFDIGFAIGGSNFTCSAEELMAAHAILMNGGNYIQPHTIARIEFRSGAQEPIVPTYDATNVLSPQAAYLAAQLMYQCVYGPYYNYMQILQRDYAVYAKTGTSDWGDEGLDYNIPQGASKDKWMVAETSMYTTAVWIGYEKGIKDQGTYIDSNKEKLNLPGSINNLILSALNDENHPAEVPQPDGISSITHIIGTFPYAAPIEGMDGGLLTTGLIKSEFNTLVDAEEAATVENLGNFSATQAADGTINFTWDPYPNPEALTVADNTMDISLSVGDIYVEAYGNRMFDYSWIYGPIRYKARISQGGNVIAEISSETEAFNQGVDLQAGQDTEVCGYYAYDSGAGASNEVCTHFNSVASSATSGSSTTVNMVVPDANTSQGDLNTWAATAGVTINWTANQPATGDHPAGTNSCERGGTPINGVTVQAGNSIGCTIYE